MAETPGCACETGHGPLSPTDAFPLIFRRFRRNHLMNIQDTLNTQGTANTRAAYAIGEPVARKEDGQLLRGQGRYTDDINLPNQAYAYVLRSTIAHGRIRSINTDAAKNMPGVLGIYTGEDIKPYGTLQSALPF